MVKSSSGYQFKFNGKTDKPIYKYIAEIIARDIEKGILQKKVQLPSVNEFSSKYAVARDTIEKAYGELKKQNYISSAPGKGYFVIGKKESKLKVLLVFNKLSSYKKMVYDAIIETMDNKAKVDLQVHHYDPHLLREIVETSLGKYHYYVIMPHFFQHSKKKDYLPILNSIPANELVILDKKINGLQENVMGIFQNFKYDIYYALTSEVKRIKKYHHVVMIFPKETHHPVEIIAGVKKFCYETNKKFSVIKNLETEKITSGKLYIVIEENDLAKLIKKVRKTKFQTGKQIGIISFNESDLKELLDITVITTDFDKMGRTAATLILERNHSQVNNPFKIIVRNSI
jgi:DNA-binding transcriptional regulator YhcF (GntR family)